MPRFAEIRKQAIYEMMKETLFEATVTVLTEHGMNGMTMDLVASEAGVAKGSLYRYFHGKRDLLEFVYARMVDPIIQDLEAMAMKKQPAIEKLAGQLRKLLEHVAKYAQVHKLFFEDDATRGFLRSSEQRNLEVASQRLAEVFRQGIAEGVFRPGDPLILANMYLGLCKGALESEPELAEPDQRENVHQMIMGTFLNGIAAEQGRSVTMVAGSDGWG